MTKPCHAPKGTAQLKLTTLEREDIHALVQKVTPQYLRHHLMSDHYSNNRQMLRLNQGYGALAPTAAVSLQTGLVD